jgi:NAD dependent epimerase/dehydratase
VSWSKVLVTGAGGFIGSHLAERLVELGADVRALVRYTSSGTRGWLEQSPAVESMEVVAGDISDADCVRDAVRGVQVVFHLAALIGIPYSYRAPRAYLRTNVEGTVNVLQAALAEGSTRVVHTSTSEVYGTAMRVPIDEEHPLQGQSPYSASKIAADKMAEAYSRSFELPVVVVRPFNTYGPRQSDRAIVPTIVSQLLWGEDRLQLGSLHPTRDLNFVADTVAGFVAAAGSDRADGEVVNLGTGREVSIGDLAAMLMKIVGKDVPIATRDERKRPPASEVERLLADPGKARQLLGWESQVTLEDGLRQTVDWIRAHRDGFRPGEYKV